MGISGKYDIECRFMDVLFTWGNKKGSIYLFASLWFHLLHPQPLNCHSSFAVSHKQTEHTSGSSSALPVCQQILWWGKRLFSFLSHPKEAIPLYALLPAIFLFFFFYSFQFWYTRKEEVWNFNWKHFSGMWNGKLFWELIFKSPLCFASWGHRKWINKPKWTSWIIKLGCQSPLSVAHNNNSLNDVSVHVKYHHPLHPLCPFFSTPVSFFFVLKISAFTFYAVLPALSSLLCVLFLTFLTLLFVFVFISDHQITGGRSGCPE